MSRIGKQIIQIPEGVTVTRNGSDISVVGPKGTLIREFKDLIDIKIENNTITCKPVDENDLDSHALWGTYVAHLKNMIKGVKEPYQKKLILEGVGFKSEVKGNVLELALGFSHKVLENIPEGLTVTAEKNVITVTGIDKEKVGQWTARVRSLKKPEPYKGKGFRYDDEVIRRKQGKKTA